MRTVDGDDGQVVLEFALLLPVVGMLVLVFVEIGMLVADNTRVVASAREAARVAAVTSERDAIEDAAGLSGLDDLTVHISPSPGSRAQGDPVTVDVEYDPPTRWPLAGLVTRFTTLRATATMRIERP